MTKKESRSFDSVERIERRIFVIRGQRVLLDRDLAELYGVTTSALNQAVKRNLDRFPEDFMFRLDREETEALVSQIVIPSRRSFGGSVPYAFTEQGVAMLSSVLRSERAVQANIAIMRAFVRLRQLLATHADLARKLAALERKYDERFRVVFEAIRQLMTPIEPGPTVRIGFARAKQE
jgi:ORF6N domain-containing protein